tara:strand:- start:3564 stop:4586 length:1023 start_codon:yes stop_codon:yes gene_type:complete
MADDKIIDSGNPISGITTNQAQTQIMDLLAPEEDTANENEEAVDESSLLDEEGEVLEDAEFEEDEELEDEDAELVDEEDDLDDESQVAETFTVKIAGEEVEVDLAELKSGYSRTSDYTKKSQALAEERKLFMQDRDAVSLERQQYAQLLGALQAQIGATDEPAPDFDSLYETDPIEATRQERQWTKRQQERAQKLAAIQAEQARVSQASQKEQQEQMQHLLNAEVARLPDLIPAWKDEKVAKRESEELKTYLADQGISEEEMGALVRASHINVLRKAMLFDKGQRRVKKATRARRKNSVQPGASSAQVRPGSKRVKTQRQRLANGGRIDDAVNLVESLLG